MKFVHLIFRKIILFVDTRCQISRLKCTKIDFGCGSTPDPAQTAFPQILSWKEGEGEEKGRGVRARGGRKKRRER